MVKDDYYLNRSYGKNLGSVDDFDEINFEDNELNQKSTKNFLPIKKIGIIIIIVFLILLLFVFQKSSQGVEDSILFTDSNGERITMKGSIALDGEIVETFSVDGEVLQVTMNPDERNSKITLKSGGFSSGTINGVVTIRDLGGLFFISSEQVTIHDDGTIIFNLQADEYAELNSGQTFEINALVEIEIDGDGDGVVDEIIIIEVPIEIILQEYQSIGCLLIDKTEISKTTPSGFLEQEFKFRATCNLDEALFATINWKDKPMGTVELYIQESSPEGQNLTQKPTMVRKSLSTTNEYVGKLVFIPFKSYAGEEAVFSLQLNYGDTVAEINFNLALDNLEQCINFVDEKLDIIDFLDEAKITIDVSTCLSDRIDFSICPNHDGCSGGAEGKISPSAGYFYLSPKNNATKTISVSRGEIPGVYGLTFYAAVPGHKLSLISEKEIFVYPSNTILKPDKFVISLFGQGSSDLTRVKHSELAEDVLVETSVCNLYKSSTDGQGWWRDLTTNNKIYSGRGLYQTSLFDSLGWVDYAYVSAQALSHQENFKIKKTFEDTVNAYDFTRDSYLQTNSALEKIQAVNSAVDETIDFESTQDSLSLLATTNNLYTSVTNYTQTCAKVTSVSSSLNGGLIQANGLVCSGNQLFKTAYTSANSSALSLKNHVCNTGLSGIVQAYELANQIKNSYEILNSSNKDSQIDAGKALVHAVDAMDYISTAIENSNNSMEYVLLALDAVSSNSTTNISDGYLLANEYLMLAKIENQYSKEALDKANLSLTKADDELTLLYEKWEWGAEEINEIVYSLTSLSKIVAEQLTLITTTQSSINSLRSSLESAESCSPCTISAVTVDTQCVSLLGIVNVSKPIVESVSENMNSNLNRLTLINNALASSISTYDTYQQYQNLAGTQISDSRQQNISTINDYYLPAVLAENDAYLSKDAAILAAKNLAINSKQSSDTSDYTRIGLSPGNYNEKRLSGLIATAVSTGFINGAYDSGVYTTKTTGGNSEVIIGFLESENGSKKYDLNYGANSGNYFKNESEKAYFSSDILTSAEILRNFTEDCDNKVELILPDYKINLLKDTKPITISGGKIMAAWSFEEPMVFDVFEEQEVGIKFVNNSLYNNGYATVTLKFDKHSHAPKTTEAGNFGPFNITDSLVETIEEKFHFKFNSMPRKASTPVTTKIDLCSKGLIRGSTGESALPNAQLDWQWDNIDVSKYLDATQLSIIISKNLAKLDNVLKSNSTICPVDPSLTILESVKTSEAIISKTDCFLPLSTNFYDGFPAIYYYLKNSFVPVEGVQNLNSFLGLIDFNVNLIMDGYGLEFQDDFEREYTSKALYADDAFTSPFTGISKYFANSNYAYYSAETKGFNASNDFFIPDAGNYRVRILANLKSGGLFENSLPSAKLIFDLYSLQPINKNYSPFYYFPFNGSVGIKSRNDRVSYGVGGTSDLLIDKSNNALLNNEQERALFNIETQTKSNFFTMNSLNSKRGKLLDVLFKYDSKQNNVDGSKIVFSPNYATPILIGVKGNEHAQSIFSYVPKENEKIIKSEYQNLLFFNGVEKCSYYGEGDVDKLINLVSSIKDGEKYSISLNSGKGNVLLKTIVYSPVNSNYVLEPIEESNYFASISGKSNKGINLEGISGMNYNDFLGGQVIFGVSDVFDGVLQENICVAQLGDREIYWWPESIYYESDLSGNNMRIIENQLISECN